MAEFLTGEIDNAEVLEVLGKIVEIGGNTGQAMRQIAGFMENQVRLGFKKAQSPYGVPWEPVAHRDGTPLIDTRTLLGSINSAYGDDFAEVGTNSAYGPIHNFGGRTGRKKATTITARPYLPIDNGEAVLPDFWQSEILGILSKELERLTNG